MFEEANLRTARILGTSSKLKDELLEQASSGRLKDLAGLGVSADELEAMLSARKAPRAASAMRRVSARLELPPAGMAVRMEAIVRRFGRPPILVRNGTYVDPPSRTLRDQLKPHRKRIDAAIARVGRVEFVFHQMPWGGTGWLVDKNIIVTNRHVAELVAEADGRGRFRFRQSPIGRVYGAKIDFREEHGSPISKEVPVVHVRFLASRTQPDIALLEINGEMELPQPIQLSSQAVKAGQDIGVIGYPADDPLRNAPEDIARYFGDIFDVKRFAPGDITQASSDGIVMHDATTLGGNSGSLLFDLQTGDAVGLHFAGEYLTGNYAVDAATIKATLRGLKTVAPASVNGSRPEEKADSVHQKSFFRNRDGYAPDFLGERHRVALPGLATWKQDIAEATEHDGTRTKILNYRHFSVAFSKSRKVPVLTAVNIDGGLSRRIKRGDDQWFADLRLPREIQLSSRDYGRREIDRGHMVRREDPVWGKAGEAGEANFDTFHYTNAAPQHADLNQRAQAWRGLEDYILEHTRTQGLKASVFTGPVLRDDDPVDPDYPKLGKIPREFWKIVVAIDADTKKLYATGYVLSQGDMIRDFTEAIVFGDWGTYQVPIAMIAKATGLTLTQLVAADTMNHAKPRAKRKGAKGRKRGKPEGLATGLAVIPISSAKDIYLG